MAIAISIEQFLKDLNIDYDVTHHRRTNTSFNSAVSAHLPTLEVAKAVVLKDQDNNYLMAVVPSNRRVMIDKINETTNNQYSLVGEHEIYNLFQDCVPGAIPPLGQIYHLDMIVDDLLFDNDDIYLESGDHENLIHLDNEQFKQAMQNIVHKPISSFRMTYPEDIERERNDWE